MTLENKRILVFGGSGSLGRALIRRLYQKNRLFIFSRDEAKHWTIRNEFASSNLDFAVGDIRDRARVTEVIRRVNPEVILIASALKQVDTCEMTPMESVQTNIIGIENVVSAVESVLAEGRASQIESVLLVSTDKACAPVNVYGMCKAIAERLITSRSQFFKSPKFMAVRYGNVLESRGSIIPLFRYQVENLSAITVTHPEMTRFLMTLDDSIDLILTALSRGASGDTWLPRLKAMKIMDLAEIFAERYNKKIDVIGMRPGEKIHESLISDTESIRVIEEQGFYVMKPAFVPLSSKLPKRFEYSSGQDLISKSELKNYLESIGIFDRPLSSFEGNKVEEIRTR